MTTTLEHTSTNQDLDDASVFDEDQWGGFSKREVDRKHRPDLMFEDHQVRRASERVRKSGALDLLQKWHEEDNPIPGLGGRPRLIHEHAVLVGLMLLAQEHSSLFLRDLSILFQHRLSDNSKALLDLPIIDPLVGRLPVHHRWEKNTANAFHRILNLMDPFPMKRYTALTYTQVQQVLEAHDDEHEQKMKARLDAFTNAFLLMTFMEQPRRLRRASKTLDVSIDQSYLSTPNPKGFSKKKLKAKVALEQAAQEEAARQAAFGDATQEATDRPVYKPVPGPVDPFADWHAVKDESARKDLRPGSSDSTSPGDATDLIWGWMINTCTRVDSKHNGVKRFPLLALAATFSLPNVGVSEEAVKVLKYALNTGLDAGIVAADKQYFAAAKTERLHEPVAELGYGVSTEYRIDRLGVQGGKGGAEFIEGNVYCPGMPAALKNANKDFIAGTIDSETFRARIKARIAYALRNKERPDAKGRVPKMCPALGNSPTVVCKLREMAKNAANKQRPEIEEDDLPEHFDAICRQHSVTFTEADLLRQKQVFEYKSDEWEEFHGHARQAIEGLHSSFKDEGKEHVSAAQRRKVRGFAAAQVLTTILLANFNLRTIASFLFDEQHETEPAGPRMQNRRDRLFYNPYTKTNPEISILELQREGKLPSPLRR